MLVTNDECIESSVVPIETKRLFEKEETAIETLNKTPTIHDHNSEEDLVVILNVFKVFFE